MASRMQRRDQPKPRDQNEDQLRLIIESAPYAMIIVDADGKIVFANAQTEKTFGYTRDELLGQMIEILIPVDLRSNHRHDRSRFNAHPRARSMGAGRDLYGLRKDGSQVAVEIALTPIRSGDNVQILASIIDITERKRLEETRLKLSAIIESSSDGIVSRSLDGTVLNWNEGAERLYGYTAEEMIGHPFLNIVPPGPYEDEHVRLESLIKAGKSVEPIETVRLRKDGHLISVSITLSPIRNTAGVLIGISSVARDITERKSLEREVLKASETERKRVGQELHDGMGQQLLGIRFLTDALMERLAQRSLPEAADAGHISRLIEKVMSDARQLSRSLYAAELEAHGLREALKELVANVNATTNIHCRFVCDDTLSIEDKSVATNTYRIAQEAVHNARRHSMATEIVVTVAVRDGELHLSIKDNGIGLPDGSHSMGMGLKTMRYRADVMGGTFQASHNKGGGVVITCAVPLGIKPS